MVLGLRGRIAIGVVALLSVLWAAGARAEDNVGLAQQRFEAGRAHYAARQFSDALADFEGSHALWASPNSRLYVARCLRELGRIAEAVPAFELTAREAADRAETDPRYRTTRDAAQAEVRPLVPRIARLRVEVRGPSTPARVRIGARTIPPEGAGLPIPVDPGHIVVGVEADGYRAEERAIDLGAGEEGRIEVELQPLPPAPPPAVVDFSRAPPLPPRRGPSAWSWVSLGVGVLALGGFGTFAVLGENQYQQLLSVCGPMPCPSESAGVAQGRMWQLLANVSLGVGIAGVVVGAALLLFVRVDREREAPVRLHARADGVTLEVRW